MGSVATKVSSAINKIFPNPNKFTYKWQTKKFFDVYDFFTPSITVKECSWQSSHNSVVGDVQILGPASINILASVLNAGCRAIELDIFEHETINGKPVVAHGNQEDNLQVTPAVNFESCCKLIRDYAWVDTNAPLFVFMEMNISHVNFTTQREITRLVKTYFNDRIFITSHPLADIPIHALANRIVFVPSVTMLELRTITCATLYQSKQFHNRSSKQDIEDGRNDDKRLIRVYAANTFLSNNPDPTPFLKMHNHFVCLNWTYNDDGLKIAKEYFKTGIRLF